MSTYFQQIPRDINGQVDLSTVYVAAGDEFRVTVSSRMRAMGIPNSRWMPVTPAMVGNLIGADIDPCIEIRRKFSRNQPQVASDVPNSPEVQIAQDRFNDFLRQRIAGIGNNTSVLTISLPHS